MTEVTLLTAFVAGIFSVSSPCCLPLIPIFLTHIAGGATGQPGGSTRALVLRNAAAYVAGFSLVFIALGAALGAVGAFAGALDFVSQNRYWMVRIGGVLLILLGVHQLGWLSIPMLNRTRRVGISTGSTGSVTSSFLVGVSFAAGWTPCVGPILGAILTMAAGQGSIEQATWLLTSYSLGMAVPYLAAAFAIGTAPTIVRSLNRRMSMITAVSGAIMIGVGAIMVLGLYESLFTEIVRNAPWRPWEPDI